MLMQYFSRKMFLLMMAAIMGTGCAKVVTGFYGMKQPKAVDEATVYAYGKRFNIPEQDSYTLDTAYIPFLFSLDTINYKAQIKNHYQPLQVLYYGRDGWLQSFHVNCYVSGFPNLQWNRDGAFDSFLPGQQAPVDSILPLHTHLTYLLPLSQTVRVAKDNYDHVIVVYWNRFMGRQSEQLIKLVQNNATKAGEKKVKIIYVNNDNIFAKKPAQ
jgi:hypothetical protein